MRIIAFASREEAKAAFAEFKRDVKSGKDTAAEAGHSPLPTVALDNEPTIAEYVVAQWDSLHARCGDSTAKSNRGVYRRYLLPFFGVKRIADISEADCEDFAAFMKARSPYTTNLALRFLRKVLHHARRRKLRLDVPEDFHFAKEPMLRLEMSQDEQERFLAAFCDEQGFRAYLLEKQAKGKLVRSANFGFLERRFGGGLRDDSDAATVYFERFRRSHSVFTAAMDLGYRPTDLRLLKREAVDLTKGLVAIRTQKTGKASVVALSDRCRAALEEAMAAAVASTEYVFTTSEGQPYSEQTLRRYFALAKKFAGITRRCRLADLRHTFASNLASEGLSLLDIRDALGHTTVRMSERYARRDEHSLERMREALNARQQRSGATRVRPEAQESGQ